MSDAFVKYLRTRDHYLSNANKTIQNKQYRKASEFLWGAITQSIKSLGSLSGIMIKAHIQLKQFLSDVAKETSNSRIYEMFLELENLHRNFYDEEILEKDFPYYYRKTLDFLELIDELNKKKINE